MRYVFYMRLYAYSIHPHMVLFVRIITTNGFLLLSSRVIFKFHADIETQNDHFDAITQTNSKWPSVIERGEKNKGASVIGIPIQFLLTSVKWVTSSTSFPLDEWCIPNGDRAITSRDRLKDHLTVPVGKLLGLWWIARQPCPISNYLFSCRFYSFYFSRSLLDYRYAYLDDWRASIQRSLFSLM